MRHEVNHYNGEMDDNNTGTLFGIARFTFYEGKVDEFKQLSQQCMAIVKKLDSGTLRYEIYLNDNESEAIVLEEYKDLASLMEHTNNIGKELSDAIIATADIHGELLGDINDDFREQLKNSPVQPFVLFLQK